MQLNVNRTNVRLNPNYRKFIPRFFNTGEARSKALINKIMAMCDADVNILLHQVLAEFSPRYKNIEAIFVKHFALIKHLLTETDRSALSKEKKLLMGSYFTMEYSIEAAALFNPSIVEDPDQSGTAAGEKNVILSFRATGESHISSLIFKRGKLDENAVIHLEPDGNFTHEGVVTQKTRDNKVILGELLAQITLPEDIHPKILSQLKDTFSYAELESALRNSLLDIPSDTEKKKLKYDILSMANTSYELTFPADSLLSERVIFPVTYSEKNGIEDARFVKFTDDAGSSSYIATYTAYDGSFILPQLIETRDFCHFKVSPLHGKTAVNKGLALFPRKINGHYAMLSRIDGVNNHIMFSDDLYRWEEAEVLQQPMYPWEFVQIGNGGSPIETEKGWLVITHGVGSMRKYCLGASLLDLKNPRKVLGRLKEPLLVPNEDERYGYVPNVVYSCGSIIHGDKLFIPYAVSDVATSFTTIGLTDLLDALSN